MALSGTRDSLRWGVLCFKGGLTPGESVHPVAGLVKQAGLF